MEASPVLPIGGQTVTWRVTHGAGDPEEGSAAPTSGMETLPSRPALRRASGSLRPGPVLKGSGAHSGADNRRVWGLQPPPDSLPAGSPRMAACPDLSPQPHAWRLGARGPPASCRAEPRPWRPPAPRRRSGWAAAETSKSTSRCGRALSSSGPHQSQEGLQSPSWPQRGQEAAAAPQGGPHHGQSRGAAAETQQARDRSGGRAPGQQSPLRPHAH